MIIKTHCIKYVLIMLSVSFIILSTEMTTYAAKYLHMERPRLAAEFLIESEKDERSGPDHDRKNKSMAYSEKLDIDTRGWIYHPAFVVYSLILSPEWKQTSEQSDTSDKQKTRAFLQGYNARFVFLQNKPYTLTLSGNKNMSTFHSNFAERSISETESFGAALELKYQVLPSRLDYLRTEGNQTGFFSTKSITNQVRFGTDYKEMGGHTRIDASFLNNKQETGSTIIKTTTKNASLRNIYDLSDFSGAKLNSLFALRDLETDYSKRKVVIWSENLNVIHRKNLSTRYSIRTNRTTMGTSEKSLSRTIGFGLTHSLYENLTTGLSVSGGRSQSSSRADDSYGAGLDWHYVRNIPWGRINVDIGHSYKVNDTRFSSGFAEITDESLVLTDPQGTLLAEKNVDSASIAVTDSNQIPYINNIDYRISIIGSFTRIIRIPTGSIPASGAGATVLVDYQYQTGPAFDYSIIDQDYGVTLDLWKVWRVYYSYNRVKEDYLSGIKPDTLSKSVSHRAGTDFKWKWSMTKFEYSDRRSTELSLVRWNASEAITIMPTKRIFLSFSGKLGETKYEGSATTGDTETFNGVGANIEVITSPRTRLSIKGFRNKISGTAIKTVNSGFSSVFKWVFGIYNGNIVYNFTEDKDNISAEIFRKQFIGFVIKRDFF